MIGSISKVRPCGHSHVYKYAHAQTVSDVETISWDYKGDGNSDKEWHYEMQNLSSGNSFLRGIYYAEKIDKEFPSLTTIYCFYGNSPSLIDVKLSFPNVINARSGLADYGGANPIERTMEIKLPKATDLSGLFYENEIPYKGLKLYCPEATNITNIVEWGWQRYGYDALNAEYPKVEYASGYWWKALNYIKHDIDEDGNFSFATGKPTVGKAYTTFPSLKDAQNFGMNQELYSDYAKAFLSDLPDWTGNSENHRLRLGLHIDGKYDPELQTELLKVGNNYTPTVNISGGPSTNKNWDLTVYWNGISNGEAFIPPFATEIDFSSNDIPSDYILCSYLESDGNQYIKTDYIPTATTGMYVDAYALKSGIICGSDEYWYYWGGGNFILLHCHCYYGNAKENTDTKGKAKYPCHYVGKLNYKNDRIMTVEINEENRWMNENLPTFDFTPTREIYFFRHNRPSGNDVPIFSGKIYRFQITEGEELIRDYVPCLDSEGTPCFYELINGETLYNAGTGQFTYGVVETANS